jgi:hypothetical protein
MLPFITDAGLAPRLPARFNSAIRFPGRGNFNVCTDGMGLRLASCDAADALPRVLAVGDSQVLGWGFPFSESFAARVATDLGASPADARILAAGGADVESLRPWALELTKRFTGSRTEINLIAVNLGNDLDEMYFGRAMGRVRYLKSAFEWLTTNSYFMLDYTLLKNLLLGDEWGLPPGANPVLFALDDGERTQLARATAEATLKLAAALPPSEHTIVIVIPADYQLEPSQFDKYRKFYPSEAQFYAWRDRVSESARRLDRIEEILSANLSMTGLQVVSVKAILKDHDLGDMIDGFSHHLTSTGHELVAHAVADALRRQTKPINR